MHEPLRCRQCGDEDGPFTADGLCEECAPQQNPTRPTP